MRNVLWIMCFIMRNTPTTWEYTQEAIAAPAPESAEIQPTQEEIETDKIVAENEKEEQLEVLKEKLYQEEVTEDVIWASGSLENQNDVIEEEQKKQSFRWKIKHFFLRGWEWSRWKKKEKQFPKDYFPKTLDRIIESNDFDLCESLYNIKKGSGDTDRAQKLLTAMGMVAQTEQQKTRYQEYLAGNVPEKTLLNT